VSSPPRPEIVPNYGPDPKAVEDLPDGLDLKGLARKAAEVIALLGVLVLVAVLAPGSRWRSASRSSRRCPTS
jgi:hypothetical protein